MLKANSTWEYVKRSNLPANVKTHHGMWVWVDKYDKKGNWVELRGRFVFLGCRQVRGVDYDETFSPTGRPSTQRCAHAIASSEKLIVKQADVKAAFLQAHVVDDPLNIDIYMEQPDGFEDPDHPRDEYVCKLIRTLYGMKQSNRLWWRRLVKWMRRYGFRQSKYDPCMFYGERPESGKRPHPRPC